MPIAAFRASRVVEKNELGWRLAKSENHRAAALELHLMSNVDELPPLSRNVHTTTTRFLEGLREAVERASARSRRLIANLARRLTRLRKSSS